MATGWDVAVAGWGITVLGWLFSPVITLVLTKTISYLDFDASQKLMELKINIIPELKRTAHATDKERMLLRGAEKGDSDAVARLDMMAGYLRFALYEAEDILDLVDYYRIENEKIVVASTTWWQHLCGAAATCIACCKRIACIIIQSRSLEWARNCFGYVTSGGWSTRWSNSFNFNIQWLGIVNSIRSGPASLLEWARNCFRYVTSDWSAWLPWLIRNLFSFWFQQHRPAGDNHPLPSYTTSAAPAHPELRPPMIGFAHSHEPPPPPPVTSDAVAVSHEIRPTTVSDTSSTVMPLDEPAVPVMSTGDAPSVEPVPVDTTNVVPLDSSGGWLSCCSSLFIFFSNCCRSASDVLLATIEFLRSYRDWSYNVVGITSYEENALDSIISAISRWNLKKRIDKVKDTVSQVKKSPLLDVAGETSPEDIVNRNRSEIRTPGKRQVFGREVLRHEIMEKLLQTPALHGDASSSSSDSSTSKCYSVVGIYGVAGSGKTTFARYIREYIKDALNDKPFDVISCIRMSETFSVHDIFIEMLKDITKEEHSNIKDSEELKEKLKNSLKDKCFLFILDDFWVENKTEGKLLELVSPLNAGKKGSKILVTARKEKPCQALGDSEPTELPDLGEEQYLEMFMHHALGDTPSLQKDYRPAGREIAKKLSRSPIAAVTVGGRLGMIKNVKYWETVATDVELNTTMGALWWSYQHLDADIRRCFEYCCNIFPRRHPLRADELIQLLIAQGFVKARRNRAMSMEDVVEGYFEELVACSFLRPDEYSGRYFTIHDLLRDLARTLAGSDFFICNNGHREGISPGQIKPDIPRDVCHLWVENYDGKLLSSDILELENLRTLIIFTVGEHTRVRQKVLERISKRLRKLRVLAVGFLEEGLAIRREKSYKLSFPESISQLMHLRYLAFRPRFLYRLKIPTTVTKLYHMQLLDVACNSGVAVKIPNIGRLVSIRTMSCFTVRQEEGCEVKQLNRLNELGGELKIDGLENVKSKKDASDANLAAKRHITELTLDWGTGTRCSAEEAAEVLEGLCPPKEWLWYLQIMGYRGSTFPNWMVYDNIGGRGWMRLRRLELDRWSQRGPAPEFVMTFPALRVLSFTDCDWDALPGNMGELTSLEELCIFGCKNIQELPTLPLSLKAFTLGACDSVFMMSCQTSGDPNYQKIDHIPRKQIVQTSSNAPPPTSDSETSDGPASPRE